MLRSIPILRIFDEAKAREFYVDFLGFTVDWEHRFNDDAPLYMQVSRDGCVLHFSEHYGDAWRDAARPRRRGRAAWMLCLGLRRRCLGPRARAAAAQRPAHVVDMRGEPGAAAVACHALRDVVRL